jgi:Zn-dependent protease
MNRQQDIDLERNPVPGFGSTGPHDRQHHGQGGRGAQGGAQHAHIKPSLFSPIELRDLLKAWGASSLAYAFAMVGLSANLIIALPIALFTAGIGIILHELAHKFVAKRYGYHAEFRSNDQMLLMSILISFLGVVFLAPGAVFFSAHYIDARRNGIISLSGPLTNILLAILCVPLILTGLPIISLLGQIGMQINAWLAMFNLIPFMGIDGEKVLAWNRYVWALAGLLAVSLVFASNYFF